MGGAPIIVKLFKNGIYVLNAAPAWFPCQVMLKKAHALPGTELLSQILNFNPDFKKINDALPAVDSFEMKDEYRDTYFSPTKQDLLTREELWEMYKSK